jgi:type IV pilus assembly protein PilB
MARARLGELLIEVGLLTNERLELALTVQRRTHERLGRILQRLGFVRPGDLAKTLAQQYNVEFLPPQKMVKMPIDFEALDKLTLDFAKTNIILPVIWEGKPSLAIADILNTKANDKAQATIGKRPYLLSTETAIATAIEVFSFGGKDGEKIVESARDTISKGELNELLGYLLGRAVILGASDIHIEPSGPVSVVRYRIDGVMQPEISLPRERHDNLVNILFGKSGIDLSDFHRLRDGRFSFAFAGRTLDVRFASSPTVEGPMTVMRILDDTRSLTKLEELGYTEWNLEAIHKIARHPHGVIFFVGPTGSGKTTTLYSLLSQLNDTQTKILTVEDPVEIKLPSVQQVQVNDKSGVTFANAIRGFLRQDPDVILVGEIRDEETAREAFRAANTGHLVLTTLHANSSVESVNRLQDLGLEPFRVADGTVGIIAQRLIRKLCTACCEPAGIPEMPTAMKASKGCKECIGGYSGRGLVAEVLVFTDELREGICNKASIRELTMIAKNQGFRTMSDNGLYLVIQGFTSVDEAERVLGPLDLESSDMAN